MYDRIAPHHPGAPVRVLLAPPFVPEALRGAHVVVIDVLRATTTIATALAAGAAGVVPVAAPEDAVALARRLGRDRVLLCGERDAVMIPGFDLDNAPSSYVPEVVAGKTLAFTTTNGTAALRAASGARSVRAAALVNRAAVADALAAEDVAPIVVVCAGDGGGFALEDALGAGALVDALLARVPHFSLDDGARACALLYRGVAGRLPEAVASADHASVLVERGFVADVSECAALDVLRVVPTQRDGILVADAAGAPPIALDGLPGDPATALAARLEETLPGLRERYGGEYRLRDRVNGVLLAGALHAYVGLAFREKRGDETLRAITAAFESLLDDESRAARDLAEGFLEGCREWPLAWQSALRGALGTRTAALYGAIAG